MKIKLIGSLMALGCVFSVGASAGMSAIASQTNAATNHSMPLALGSPDHLVALSGTLDQNDLREWDDSYYDAYTFEGVAGQSVTVTMTSNGFTPYIYIVAPDGQPIGEALAGGEEATITVTLPSTGTYTVKANAFNAGEGGSYNVTATVVSHLDIALQPASNQTVASSPSTPSPSISNGNSSGGTSASQANASCSNSVLTEAQIQSMLDLHNQARAETGAGLSNLRWDCNIAAVAQEWADRGDFNHSDGDWRANRYNQLSGDNARWIGENLYWYSAANGDPGDAVTSWVAERADYNYNANSCSGVCGHYTQIVWDDTTHVGCGVYNEGETIVVCQYSPGGNIVGNKPY